jgi:truncated hemoglobin YjbI
MLGLMRPTLYEFAGGDQAFLAFAAALHARCLADPELNHPFSHPGQHPQHVERLALYLAETMGGPPRYSVECGDQSGLVLLHSGNGDMSDLGRRFADCFMLAADDAGWPDDTDFRSALRSYIDSQVDEVALSHPDDSDIPPGLSIPHWSWDGPQRLGQNRPMATPPRLVPLLEQYEWACMRLLNRMTGPEADSGTGTPIPASFMTDEEYFWEPVPGSWSVRRRADGPGPGANVLLGAGEWGRDSAEPEHPYPPPFTTIAWRLSHISEMLTLRADHTVGGHDMTSESYRNSGDADGAIMAFNAAAEAWRGALVSADDVALDMVGLSSYPYGSDHEDVFIDTVWWVNQEILHHGAEIALLRDLYRASGLGR